MSSTRALVAQIKQELKSAGITYAVLAKELGLAESSVKRMLACGEMPLSRIDAICRVLRCDFADLARRVADAQPLVHELTLAQERALVNDRKLLLLATCCLSHWTLEQVVGFYRITEAEAVQGLVQLDRLGVIELRPLNRYRLKLAKTFRWRPNGPAMQYFREVVLQDYFSGSFDGDAETLTLVHGQIGSSQAQLLHERLLKLAEDFAQQHLADQRLPAEQKRAFTLVLAMRSWLFASFRDLKREGSGSAF